MPAGRPLKFKTPADLERACDAYFESCWEEQRVDTPAKIKDGAYTEKQSVSKRVQVRPYTITGLALALDTTRDLLLDYETEDKRKEYSDTIKKAKQRCHNYAEEFLYVGKNPTGAIFNLKNNWGWKDKTEVELSSVDDRLKELAAKRGTKD